MKNEILERRGAKTCGRFDFVDSLLEELVRRERFK
jgi:hypothetical protein